MAYVPTLVHHVCTASCRLLLHFLHLIGCFFSTLRTHCLSQMTNTPITVTF